MLRSNLPPTSVYVIPNAIVADHFRPPSSRPPTDASSYSRSCPLINTYSDPHTHVACTVTIVVISRLAYRKGVDLLVATAPRICAAFPNVRFVVGVYFVLPCDFSHYGITPSLFASGGDGPKMVDLLQMRETHFLQDRITLLGPVAHRDVPSVRAYYIDLILKFKLAHPQVLQKGSIFLNTSLTEAFGIAILEAACAGLYVVSTRVGGVPEILPEDMISFAAPTADGGSPTLSRRS